MIKSLNKANAPQSISDTDFNFILDVCWEQLALFAFENHMENGRPDSNSAGIIASYDPV
ncbi:MAG: hypothetical protein PHP23_05380 [Desulfobacterales bacterium]|nr:hypothetical protein [Desulfobacterales bacterium]MDD4073557.1 hypothetical protein [Desulfobacterales bacterium]MDD4392029.1 hypothetical protein [Desulfobacterales bacterium]